MNENQNMNNSNNNEVNSDGGMFVKTNMAQEEKNESQEKPETNSFSFEMPSVNNVDLDKTAVLSPMENNDKVVEQLMNSNNNVAANVSVDESTNKVDDNPFNFSVNPNITYDTQSSQKVGNDVKKEEDSNIVPVKKYLGYMILFSIPLVGFVMLIVKACSKNDKNISNYAKAQLLLVVIMTVLSIIITVLITVFILNVGGNSISNTYYNSNYSYDFD